jgi:hypothetical protein
MITPELKCPTCHDAMQRGFVVDFTFGGALAANWVEGLPKKTTFWSGIWGGAWGGVDLKGRGQREIVAFRCPRCGLLQNYAL